jgi:hypothetical protein
MDQSSAQLYLFFAGLLFTVFFVPLVYMEGWKGGKWYILGGACFMAPLVVRMFLLAILG